MTDHPRRARAQLFRYLDLDVSDRVLLGRYELDGEIFHERVEFTGVDSLARDDVRAVAELWFLVAGLSYYKAGAARRVEVNTGALGPASAELLRAALRDGLGEFAYRNDLDLSDVDIATGALPVAPGDTARGGDPGRVLVPFGGGIDSVVTLERLSRTLERALFIVSPPGGRFEPLERTAAATGLDVVRATRTLDPAITERRRDVFRGHVPVTAMVTLLATVAAVASHRGGVVMSNEHSASVANLTWRGRPVNHQWSKSWVAEELITRALSERIGPSPHVASFLRARSELWVAREFAQLDRYHHVFRSCNRAFHYDPADRVGAWCGECDKCLFINLVLAPFLARESLHEIFASEPLANASLETNLRTLVGLGLDHKPFECVGDPTECASALAHVARLDQWRDVTHLGALAEELGDVEPIEDLLRNRGEDRVPAHWL